MRTLLFLLLTVLVWGVELQEKEVMENLEKMKKNGIISEDRFREIESFKEKLKGVRERSLERAREWKVEKKGDRIVVKRKGEKTAKEVHSFPTLYIFISSSVPLEVWWKYAHYLLDRNIPGVFVLRGCIGGCRYIRPTLEFIRRFLTEDGTNEEGLPVEVQIDPLKFRNYGVKVVPCVALKGGGKLSCGDWNMEHHLKVLGVGNGKS